MKSILGFAIAIILLSVSIEASKIRVAHASFDAPAVNVTVNGTLAFSNVAFKDVTQYADLAPHFYVFDVYAGNTLVYSLGATLEVDKVYTVVASGLIDPTEANQNFTLVTLQDDNKAPDDSSSTRIRFYHGVPDAPAVDVRANGQIIFSQINFKSSSQYLQIPAGTYNVEVLPHNSSLVVFSVSLTFNGGDVATILAEGILKNLTQNQISGVVSQDASYSYFNVRVAHTVVDAPHVDIVIRDLISNMTTVAFSNLGYGASTPYKMFSFQGSSQIEVTPTGKNDVIVYSTLAQYIKDKDNTIILTGLLANSTRNLEAIFLQDNNQAPKSSFEARLRFFHAISNAPSVNLIVDVNDVFDNVDYGKSSEYKAIPSGEATVKVVLAQGAIVATLDYNFSRGGVYTLLAVGLSGSSATSPEIIIINDATYEYVTLRVGHASPNAPPVDVSLTSGKDTLIIYQNLAYGKFSEYSTIVLKKYTVNLAVGDQVLFKKDLDLTKDTVYTILAQGFVSDPLMIATYADTNTAPKGPRVSRARFVHVAPRSQDVDVYINDKLIFANVAFGKSTDYTELFPAYSKVVISSGNLTILETRVDFAGGHVTSLFLEGVMSNTTYPTSLVVTKDAEFSYFTFRATHASADAPAVDIILDDGMTQVTAVSNLGYQQISSYKYMVLSSTNFTIKVVPTGKFTPVLYATEIFKKDATYTLAVVGLIGPGNQTNSALRTVLYEDSAEAPATSRNTKARFIHAVPSGPSVDVRVNDVLIFSGLDYTEASEYAVLDTSDNNRVEVYVAKTTVNPIYRANVNFIGGQVLSVFVEKDTNNQIFAKIFLDTSYSYFNMRVAHASPVMGPFDVLVDSVTLFTDVNFNNVTSFRELLGGERNLTLSGKDWALSQMIDTNDTTVMLTGLKNATSPLKIYYLPEYVTLPTAETNSKLRFVHAVPLGPAVDVLLNGTAKFRGIFFAESTNYVEIGAGIYTVTIVATGANITVLEIPSVFLHPGFSYSLFAEGLLPKISHALVVDGVPSSDFNLRAIHVSPNLGTVDILINKTLTFSSLNFGVSSAYLALPAGEKEFELIPENGDLNKPIYTKNYLFKNFQSYTYLVIGNKNATANETGQEVDQFVLEDDNSLPNAGDIKIRFVHASPDSPQVEFRIDGNVIGGNVAYKSHTNYTISTSGRKTIELLTADSKESLFSSQFDLRAKDSTSSAVFTIIAEGLAKGEPRLKLVSYLDNGEAPAPEPAPKKKGLSGLAIGLIIGGVALFVILLASVGFVLYKKRSTRAGYTEISARE